ncbi:MAG: RsmD family RNA methyltransferase [Halobacteriovoraceae bacterium]|nr:RsmD family RNA methyltransferase [Halobacteriovoraceae bacterium]MCB9094164.1 RsmD family RNA methyltransferase [Halobacteriovoraceae bacterium]
MKDPYLQPLFYHFSELSIALSNYAVENTYWNQGNSKIVLDLFSGCGVVLLEAISQSGIQNIAEAHFCEIQSDFIPYIEKNIKRVLGDSIKAVIHHKDFRNLELLSVDLITGNIPFFDPQKNRVSSNPQKRVCHFRMDFSLLDLVEKVNDLLSQTGKAYLALASEDSSELKDLLQDKGFQLEEKRISKDEIIIGFYRS